ncbi:MAG: hypothetical protein MUE44_26920 [Oscillatoriaceae cyanobacterium Prado104]|nr:hypothetical protein [Oscillatoriaceae cyanobacterium Prado104]
MTANFNLQKSRISNLVGVSKLGRSRAIDLVDCILSDNDRNCEIEMRA